MKEPLFNFGVMALAALVPLVMGFIWYHKKTFGTAWMQLTGMTDEKAKESNMALTFILCYVLSFMLAFVLSGITIHQNGLFSLFEGNPDATEKAVALLNENLKGWENNFRTFKHGALHGFVTGVFIVLPVIATNAMFEQRKWKLTFINSTYWIVSISLMGGIICAFS